MTAVTSLGVSVDTSGVKAGINAFDSFTKTADNAANSATKFERSASKVSSSTHETATKLNSAAASSSRLADSLNNQAARANAAAASTAKLGSVAESSSASMARLAQVATVSISAKAVIDLIDGYTKFNAQLGLATKNSADHATAMSNVKAIAKGAQQGLGEVGTLYARIANGTEALGLSQQRLSSITEVVALSLKVSGATAAESSSAMLQLSQAFASGTLRGEEFNSVNEAAPRLMKALAEGIGVPVGKLREMAADGKITSEIMSRVLPQALEQLRTEAAKIQTIGGSFVELKNAVMEFAGATAESSGVVSAVTSTVSLLAGNLDVLSAAALGFGAVKLAQVFQATSLAALGGASRSIEYIGALTAQRAAAIATATAERNLAAANVAAAETTLASNAATRADLVIKLEAATVAHALASAESKRTGAALSAAAAAQQLAATNQWITKSNVDAVAATAALTAAEAAHKVALDASSAASMERATIQSALTRIDTASAATTTALTAATSRQTAAQTALTAAMGAATTAATLAGRALTLVGGPLGLLNIALGVGTAAWMLWGRTSADESARAAGAMASSHAAIMGNLNDQIAKLEQRQKLMSQGISADSSVSDAEAQSVAKAKEKVDAMQALQDAGKLSPADQVQLITMRGFLKDQVDALERRKTLTSQVRDQQAKLAGDDKTQAALKSKYATDEEKHLKAVADIKAAKLKPADEAMLLARENAEYTKNQAAEAAKLKDSYATSAENHAKKLKEINESSLSTDEKSLLIAREKDRYAKEGAKGGRAGARAQHRQDNIDDGHTKNKADRALEEAKNTFDIESSIYQQRAGMLSQYRSADLISEQQYVDGMSTARAEYISSLQANYSAEIAILEAKKSSTKDSVRKEAIDTEIIKKQNELAKAIRGVNDESSREELDLFIARIKRLNSAAEAADPLRKYAAEMKKLNEDLAGGMDKAVYEKQARALKTAYEKSVYEAKKELDGFVAYAEIAGSEIEGFLGSGLADLAAGSYEKIGESFGRMIESMLVKAAQAQIMNALFGSAGVGGGTDGWGSGLISAGVNALSGMFGGGRANGGSMRAGNVYEVGERGDELFRGSDGRQYMIPSRDGTMLSNERLTQEVLAGTRSSQGTAAVVQAPAVQVNVINQTGQKVQAEQRTRTGSDNSQIIEIVLKEVAADIRGGGQVADAMQGQYGLNRSAGIR